MSNLARFAFMMGAAALFAGCGGSQGLIGQQAGGATQAHATLPLSTGQENMYTRHVHAGQCVTHGSVTKVAFRAHGAAKGKYPGLFKTHGTISAVAKGSRMTTWSYREQFTISSGDEKIAGTIEGSGSHAFRWSPCDDDDFRDANLRYMSGSVKNRAQVDINWGDKVHFGAQLLGF